ncbi:hypothetical protein AVEN_199960-1 [Araneus ventricosus]|uniref:Uncharacterized protein n=1 Tax=Araneus ventricosus TaxID=182803 RepID=A0A4Y2BXW8_ARAVE|nr:hypothetical protein AVEN_199960-1 [Araneus ventricosus]
MNIQTIRQFESGRNTAEAWKFWKQNFVNFLETAGYATQSEKTKTAVFRHVCGDEIIKPKAGEAELKLEQILDGFDKFFGDYKNEILASFVFLEIKQKPHEKFQEFYTRLKLGAAQIACLKGLGNLVVGKGKGLSQRFP